MTLAISIWWIVGWALGAVVVLIAALLLLAIIAVAIASYVPAQRAAQLPPVATLRGSGQ